jgi:hypothetical protein
MSNTILQAGRLGILTEFLSAIGTEVTTHYVVVSGSDVCPDGTPIHSGYFHTFEEANEFRKLKARDYTGERYYTGNTDQTAQGQQSV